MFPPSLKTREYGSNCRWSQMQVIATRTELHLGGNWFWLETATILMDELDEWVSPSEKGNSYQLKSNINNGVSISKGKANRFKPFGGYKICQNQPNFRYC